MKFLISLLLCIQLNAAITLVAHAGASAASATSNVTTTAVNATGGNFIVAVVASQDGSVSITLSDSTGGNTYSLSIPSQNGGPVEQIYYTFGATVSSSQTWTVNTGGNTEFASISVAVFAGVGSATDGNAGSTTGFDSSAQFGPITPTVDGDLVVAALGVHEWSPVTYSIDSGFTIVASSPYVGGSSFGTQLAYLIQTTAAAANPTWFFSPSIFTAGGTNAAFKAGRGTGALIIQ